MGRKIGAVVAGVVLAFILITVFERLSHMVYPPPADLDMTELQEVRAYVNTLPAGALLSVLLAWLVGTFGGGLLASRIARVNFRLYTGVVGGLVLLGTAINLVMIPHPLWFSMLSVLAIIATTYLTREVARRTLTPAAE